MDRLIFAVLVFTAAASAALARPNDLDYEGLLGRVKRIDEKVAAVKFKSGQPDEGSKRRSRTVVFDDQGRKTYEWLHLEGLDPQKAYFTYPDAEAQQSRTAV